MLYSDIHASRELRNGYNKVLEYGEVLNVPQADERNRVVERKEIPLFNAEVFHETIVNAFVHNSWVSGNAPMLMVFSDRIKILSRGTLPPGQTIDGFFAGEPVPVNQELSDLFLQLHISERTGRGVPKIVEVYGKEAYEFRENSIVVTIPFDAISTEVSDLSTDAQVNAQVEGKNVQVEVSISDKILALCRDAKSLAEICDILGYKDRRTATKHIPPPCRTRASCHDCAG